MGTNNPKQNLSPQNVQGPYTMPRYNNGPNFNLGQNIQWGTGAGPSQVGGYKGVQGGQIGNVGMGNVQSGGGGGGLSWWDRYTPEQKQQYMDWRNTQTRPLPDRAWTPPTQYQGPPISAEDPHVPWPNGGYHPPPGGTDAFHQPAFSILPAYGPQSGPNGPTPTPPPGNWNYPRVNQPSRSPYDLPKGFR